jgi:hypothetical protein
MSHDVAYCPGCRSPMSLDQEVCAACRRPRDEQEIENGRELVRQRAEKRRNRPFVVVYLAIGAVALVAAFQNRAFFAARAAGLSADVRREMREIETADPKPKTAEGAAAISLLGGPPSARPAAPAAAGAASGSGADDLPIPPLNPTEQWAVYGRAYDLITLLPVAGAQLNFQMAGSTLCPKVKTDAFGRFVVVLPRLGASGFDIHASHPSYAAAALYESDIPYPALPLAKREELANEAQDGDMALPALTDSSARDAVRRDVYLAPRR